MSTPPQTALGAIAAAFIPPGGPFPLGGDGVDLKSHADRLPGSTGWLRGLVRLFLFLVDLLPPLVIGRFRRLRNLDQEARERFVTRLSLSRFPPWRLLFYGLRALVLSLFYSHPEVSRQIGYQTGCLRPPSRPTDQRAVGGTPGEVSRERGAISSRNQSLEIRADVCVIGSGAGGAVMAAELAEGGKSVVILEEGGPAPRARPEEDLYVAGARAFGEDRAFRAAFGAGLPPMPIVYGKCLGGSTAVNAGTCFRIPPTVLKKWREDDGLEVFTNDYIAELSRRVEGIAEVSEVEDEIMGQSGKVFARGCEALGFSAGPVKRNAKDCDGCGACVIGCPLDAKKAMHLSYLPRARAFGARLFGRCRAERIEVAGGRVRAVEASFLGGSDGRPGRTLRVESKVVAIAAGALGTPLLLQRRRLANSSGQVGRNLHLHPGVVLGAIFEEEIDCWRGVPQSYYCDEFLDEGTIILTGALPPMLGAHIISGSGLAHKEWMSRYRGFTDAGALVSDTSSGSVRRGPLGLPFISYRLQPADIARLRQAMVRLARIYFAAGARAVFPLLRDASPILTEGDLRSFAAAELPRRRLFGGSLHPMGTCRMGARAAESVTDQFGEVHQVKGLFIGDASLFPTSIAVNPQQAIMTLATHVARHLNQEPEDYF